MNTFIKHGIHIGRKNKAHKQDLHSYKSKVHPVRNITWQNHIYTARKKAKQKKSTLLKKKHKSTITLVDN